METEIKGSLITLLDAIKASNAKVIAEEMARLDFWSVEVMPRQPCSLVGPAIYRSARAAEKQLGREWRVRNEPSGQEQGFH